MSRNYKFHNPEGPILLALRLWNGWMDVFTRNEYKDILLESLSFSQKNKGMEIFVWCIMTNHVHLIFRTTGSQGPELVPGDFKRFTSQKIVKAIMENPKESKKEILVKTF